MPDMEKVIGHLNDCMEASRRDNTWVFVRKDIVEDAIALLKQEPVEPHYNARTIRQFKRKHIIFNLITIQMNRTAILQTVRKSR